MMILVGDIGNSEIKLCLFNKKNKIIKRITFNTKIINVKILKKLFNKLNLKNTDIKKSLFCSVVPESFYILKSTLKKFYNIKALELKELPLNQLISVYFAVLYQNHLIKLKIFLIKLIKLSVTNLRILS